MVHDLGALTTQERLALIEDEPVTVNSHAFRSARLLATVSVLAPIAEMVRYHHVSWEHGNGRVFLEQSVPEASHILHLADRICTCFDKRKNPIEQLPRITERIVRQEGERFMPAAVESFRDMAKAEHIWLELMDQAPLSFLPARGMFCTLLLDIDQTLEMTKMMSHIIDFRSRFTATHSAGVATVAHLLSQHYCFSKLECKMMLIAGYLHDLGKFSVPNELLEKPAALTEREFDILRGHTFHTHRLLSLIDGFETVAQWAAFHHEKLNGKGYPFHLDDERLPLGSRIMAVADVFTALTENRPYSESMEADEVARIMRGMVANGSLCGKVVEMLLNAHDDFRSACLESQRIADAMYDSFLHTA